MDWFTSLLIALGVLSQGSETKVAASQKSESTGCMRVLGWMAFLFVGVPLLICTGVVGAVAVMVATAPDRPRSNTVSSAAPLVEINEPTEVQTVPADRPVAPPPVTAPTLPAPPPEEDREGFYWVNGGYSKGKWIEGHWRKKPDSTSTPSYSSAPTSSSGKVWVNGHYRNGKWVDGYWRSKPSK